MSTPNNQPTPPPGMEILTDYTQPLPEVCYCFGESNQWLEMASIADRDVNYPFKSRFYAIPITHPATGDAKEHHEYCDTLDPIIKGKPCNCKGRLMGDAKPVEQRQELLPCPFCGRDDIWSGWVGSSAPGSEDCGYWSTGCGFCGIEFHADEKTEAEESWNTRK